MENIIEIKNLDLFIKSDKKEYQVLYDINLNLEKGKIHSIVGESGCGKTMTAMSILGLLPKTAFIKNGQILYNNENLLIKKNNKYEYNKEIIKKIRGKNISLIPQDPMTSLNPLYTIENQIMEIIKDKYNSKKEAINRIREVLDEVRLPDINNKLKMYPHEFSGGMKQRIIIAMALIQNSKFIIADEPTTALDVTIQKQIMDLLKELQNDKKMTILLITHDLALVSNYTDTVTVIYSGHIVEQAENTEFFKNTKHPYSIALLNALPNNNSILKLKTIEGTPPNIKDVIFGCKFNPRCEFCQKGKCDIGTPILKEKNFKHYSACFIK